MIEMEDNLTLQELYLLQAGMYRSEHRRNKFTAAMNGIDLDEAAEQTDFDAIKRRADAELAGLSEEQFVFDMIGIDIETDE